MGHFLEWRTSLLASLIGHGVASHSGSTEITYHVMTSRWAQLINDHASTAEEPHDRP